MPKVVVIDNYDSFTYNVVAYCEELGADVKVFYNDKCSIYDIKNSNPDKIIISPGPGSPKDSGVSLDVIDFFHKNIPILGVCLGQQCIAEYFGAEIIKADKVMHGKTSNIVLNKPNSEIAKIDLFKNIANNFIVTRYHSLLVDQNNFIDNNFNNLVITAVSELGEIMALAHKDYPICGVQFHPEAVLTQHGHDLLNNFLLFS